MVYLQYHNAEAQGALPHLWSTEPLRVTAYTKVASAKQARGRVLLITGLGQPRRYYLWSSFTIDRCQLQSNGSIHVEGLGWQLAPPQPLTGAAFQQFKAACANFIGFRSITEMPFTKELLRLADQYQPPGKQTDIESTLSLLIEQPNSKAIIQQLQQLLVPKQPRIESTTEPTYALSVRQPHAEAILRGIKTIEYRSSATNRRGRILLYASRMPVDDVPGWMKKYGMTKENYEDLPRGVLVGSVELYDCNGGEWYLRHPQRAIKLLVPTNRPQPIWFRPF
jgi:hypothetical protein